MLRTAPALVILTLVLATLASLPLAFGASPDTFLGAAAVAGAALIFLAGAPALIVRSIYKERLAQYGMRLPVLSKESAAAFLAAAAASFLPLFYFAALPEFQAFYQLPQPLSSALLALVPLSFLYYLAEECFFRGFLTFALWKRAGLWMFPMLAALFALLHFGKPPLEIAYAALMSFPLCWLSLASKSFFPAALIHFLAALSLTIAANLR